MVAMPSPRDSSWPVQMVKVRVSTRMSSSRMPQLPVSSAISRWAISTFFSTVRAWPSSSMVSAISAAPCSWASLVTFAKRDSGPSPSSKLTELMTARPPSFSRPARITSTSVESRTIGRVEAVAKRPASSSMSATPSRPT